MGNENENIFKECLAFMTVIFSLNSFKHLHLEMNENFYLVYRIFLSLYTRKIVILHKIV